MWGMVFRHGFPRKMRVMATKKCDLEIELWKSQSKQLAEARANQFKLNVLLEKGETGTQFISVDDLNRVVTVELMAP